jgi:hypothetical protein
MGSNKKYYLNNSNSNIDSNNKSSNNKYNLVKSPESGGLKPIRNIEYFNKNQI